MHDKDPQIQQVSSPEDVKRAAEVEKEMKQRERDVEKFEVMTNSYYEFFMLGGALQWSVFRSLGAVEKAAVATARKRVREGDAKFNMKCMMAVFDNCLAKLMQQAVAAPPSPEGAVQPVVTEEVAVGKALDEVEKSGIRIVGPEEDLE